MLNFENDGLKISDSTEMIKNNFYMQWQYVFLKNSQSKKSFLIFINKVVGIRL